MVALWFEAVGAWTLSPRWCRPRKEHEVLPVWKYVLAWLPMVLIAVANGALREAWYGKQLSELRAHQLSTITGVLLFGVYIWVLLRIWRPESPGQAFAIGLSWLGLTIAFEFLFGHYVAGHPWSKLFYDYNILEGRVWTVVLLWIAVAPYICFRLQH
jgi:hypothetical protein